MSSYQILPIRKLSQKPDFCRIRNYRSCAMYCTLFFKCRNPPTFGVCHLATPTCFWHLHDLQSILLLAHDTSWPPDPATQPPLLAADLLSPMLLAYDTRRPPYPVAWPQLLAADTCRPQSPRLGHHYSPLIPTRVPRLVATTCWWAGVSGEYWRPSGWLQRSAGVIAGCRRAIGREQY